MKHGVKDFVNALFGTGSDGTDGNGYANAAGNTLGSWMARLTWHGADWSLSTYYDHFLKIILKCSCSMVGSTAW